LTGYDRDRGDGLWRRSLYTYWKRTVLAPNMQVLDASAREFCTVRETRTNTPLQALNPMNDVPYIEAARIFAQRIISEGGSRPEERLTWAFRVATSRPPNARELQVLLNDLKRQTDYFREDPGAVAALLAVGQKRNRGTLDHTQRAACAARVR